MGQGRSYSVEWLGMHACTMRDNAERKRRERLDFGVLFLGRVVFR